MPIEFTCDACHQLLRVPDGSQGRSCQCPGCQRTLVIPGGAATAPGGGRSGGGRTAEDKLRIACPKCRFELVCSRSLLGTKGQCRNCQTIFTIGDGGPAAPTAGAPGPGSVFTCPKCEQLFEGRAEMQGRKGKCHVCGSVFVIELKPASAATNPTAVKSAGRAATAGQPVTSIRFACVQCHGVMEVPGSTAGRTTECPYCQHRLTIPRQSTAEAIAAQEKYFAPAMPTQPQVFPQAPASGLKVKSEATGAFESAEDNPYASPSFDPLLSLDASDEWTRSAPHKKVRGLSFGNVFELTFASLFPYCLVAAAAFTLVAGLSIGLTTAAALLAGAAVSVLQLDPKSAAGMAVIYSLVSLAAIVAICLVTAVYCMTCNTALHVVRGKRITNQILFGTGESYGGMLVLMFVWTGFNVFRELGIPWIAEQLAGAPGMIAVSATILLLLVQAVLMLFLAYVPYALLDGQSLPDAIGTSSSIVLRNFATVLAVNICGGLLYGLVSVVTCGLGFIIFVGGMFYLNATVYHLSEK